MGNLSRFVFLKAIRYRPCNPEDHECYIEMRKMLLISEPYREVVHSVVLFWTLNTACFMHQILPFYQNHRVENNSTHWILLVSKSR
uniref:Uncharacterized protein n=1 Tax=Solanum tuberosum TaxID=4113 RepID=M1CME9_SOLTU